MLLGIRINSVFICLIHYGARLVDYKNYNKKENENCEEGVVYFGLRFHPTHVVALCAGISRSNMLNQYVEDNLNNPKILLNLAEQIKLISRRLNQLKMSHGDLQHGNILISSQGKPVLIDYDGMYTPNMSYNKSNEVGHLNFQHPQRNSAFFNEKIDRFSTIVLYLSLHCLASPYGRQLWQSYHTGENLIFSRKDYENPGASQLFAELRKNLTVAPLVKNFERLCAYQIDKIPCLLKS